MALFLLLNGPNLNLLGAREPGVYGNKTLAAIEAELERAAVDAGHSLTAFQSNSEAALVDRIHAAREQAVACALFNPAAFTHTSIALRDALTAAELAFVEIHLSNIAAREDFRKVSYFSDIAIGTICGFGADGYRLALCAAMWRYAARPNRD